MEKLHPKHEIKINDYSEDVKSLGFKTPNGLDATIGVMNPGQDLTFSTDRAEAVTILSGRLEAIVEGVEGSVILETGHSLTFPAKSKITFRALDNQQVAYKCVYIPHKVESADGGVNTAGTANAADQVLKS